MQRGQGTEWSSSLPGLLLLFDSPGLSLAARRLQPVIGDAGLQIGRPT